MNEWIGAGAIGLGCSMRCLHSLRAMNGEGCTPGCADFDLMCLGSRQGRVSVRGVLRACLVFYGGGWRGSRGVSMSYNR